MIGDAMVPVTYGHTVIHECRGLKKTDREHGERRLCIERLPEDHPSRTSYEVRVEHPEYVQPDTGPLTKQSPEIVYRGNDEAAAKNVYATYAKVLGGSAPSAYVAQPSDSREDSKRIASLERQLDELRGAVELLKKK